MNSDRYRLPGDFRDLIDAYCDGQIDEEGLRRLEACLMADAGARREFVAYFQMHTELEFSVRARQAAALVLDWVAIEEPRESDAASSEVVPIEPPRPSRWRSIVRLGPVHWRMAAAALVAVALGSAIVVRNRRPSEQEALPVATLTSGSNVAWLVNAQDSQWVGIESDMPGRDMRAGKVLRLQRGLAEIEFDRGARLILQGPAGLVLISGDEARLLHGTLTAKVPPRARGFTVYSPRGKFVDLGTEFGLSVDDQGGTAVRVFQGQLVASPLAGSDSPDARVTLHEDQAARVDEHTVAVKPEGGGGDDTRYIRAIKPPPAAIAHIRTLDFLKPVAGSLKDVEGRGVGLTHRLPGTGFAIFDRDPNLRLDASRGSLELITTRSDINTQQGMPTGEYLGVRLADQGFTGAEDFSISTTIPRIPGLEKVGQFGLYAGTRSDRIIRGGLISLGEPNRYVLFLVNNDGGIDSDYYEVGLMNSGDDLRLTLRRVAGLYSLVVENLTKHNSSTLAIAHPAFLDGEQDLHVGLFGANTQSDVRKTLTIKEIDVKVWSLAAPSSWDRVASVPKPRAGLGDATHPGGLKRGAVPLRLVRMASESLREERP
ncbi:hypothetical protein [Singulisphaera sp. PoT]|uniref:hypothetical protein n=1 Tax=Singulisphaera sp. PoT TaxID=3411797 RepID=UPI003BF48319